MRGRYSLDSPNHDPVAQLVERRSYKAEAGGAIPPRGTSFDGTTVIPSSSSGPTVLRSGFSEFPAGAPSCQIATCVPNRPSRRSPWKLAQWLEHTTPTRTVGGSTPSYPVKWERLSLAVRLRSWQGYCHHPRRLPAGLHVDARVAVKNRQHLTGRSTCYASRPNLNPALP